MKKLLPLSILSLTSVGLLSACVSSSEPKDLANDSPEAKALISSDFYPDTKCCYKDRNNFVLLDISIDPVDVSDISLPDGIDVEYITSTLKEELEGSKHFKVIDASQDTSASINLKVRVNISYSGILTTSSLSTSCEARMAFVATNTEGVEEFSLKLRGADSTYSDAKKITGAPTSVSNEDRNKALAISCIDKCFKRLYPELAKAYPISGTIKSVHSTGNKTILNIAKDKNDGIVQSMPFVIGYTNADNEEIFIARGHSIVVNEASTQILIDEWNLEDEPVSVVYAKAKIAENDKNFIDKMFFLSKYRTYLKK